MSGMSILSVSKTVSGSMNLYVNEALGRLKEKRSEAVSWPVNVDNVKIFPAVGFI